MKLTRISIQGLNSFEDRQTLDLPETGLIQIVGRNLNTGGSSGAGKSSFTTAISYLLDYSRSPATRLQCRRHGAPKLEVVGVFEDGERQIEVSRSPGKLGIALNGSPVKGSVKGLEERLWREIGVTKDFLGTLCHRWQGERSVFLSMDDGRKKEFLGAALGLEAFEQRAEKAEADAKQFAAGVETFRTRAAAQRQMVQELGEPVDLAALEERTIQARLQLQASSDLRQSYEVVSVKATLAAREVVVARTAQLVLEEQQAANKVAEARIFLATVPEELTQESKRLSAILTEIQRRLVEVASAEEVRRQAWAAELEKVRGRAWDVLNAKREFQEGLASIEKAQAKVAELHTNTCPTCKQTWTKAQEEIERLNLVIQVLVDRGRVLRDIAALPDSDPVAWGKANPFTPCETLLALTSALENTKVALRGVQADIAAHSALEKRRCDAGVQEAAAGLESVRARLREAKLPTPAESSILLDAETNVRHAMRDEETLSRGLYELQQQVKTAGAAAAQRARIEGALRESEDAEIVATAKTNIAQDVASMLRGFLAYVFDETLLTIAQETNHALEGIPNVRHCALSWRSEVINKKGEVSRRAIVPVLHVGGVETDLLGVSGGQRSAIYLAVDLAVLKVMEGRSGYRFGWLVLDEAFDGLGGVEKEGVLELLKRESESRLILVVDHAAEIQGVFDREIIIEHLDERSYFV